MATEAAPQVRAVTLGLAPSFGFGDRIGLATPGHVAAMERSGAGIEPIFAQQSIREMERTDRSPTDVMHDALHGMVASSWFGGTGADADHLKTTADIDATHAAGYTFYTIDPSDHVDEHADSYDEATLRARYAAVRDETDWVARYQGREVTCGATTVTFDELACVRCAVKYGRAIRHALMLGDHIRAVNEAAGTDYEIELSVDETEQPTTLAEHYIVAELCIESGMKLVSLAPRYVGDFEKGVDYKGDVAALERSLCRHADIADALGPYKLSLHSGSDKLSMYPAFARASRGRFHVKTAGTSYLEALRVVARHDEALFRRIIDFGRARYDTDKATYHVSGDGPGSTARRRHRRCDRTGALLPGTVGPRAGGQGVHAAGPPDSALHLRVDVAGCRIGSRDRGGAARAPRHLRRGAGGPLCAPPGRVARGTELSNVQAPWGVST